MRDSDHERYRLHARLPVHKRRVERATQIVREALELCEAPYIAFSCGKDSAAMMHIVRQVRQDIPARILLWEGESDHIGDFHRVIADWRAMGQQIDVLTLSRESLKAGAGRWGALEATAPCDSVFVGIRRDESRTRRLSICHRGEIYRRVDGIVRVAPVAGLSTEDVAAIIGANRLPCLSIYHEHGFDERTTTRVPRGEVREEFLYNLRERDPGAWSKIIQRFPELARY